MTRTPRFPGFAKRRSALVALPEAVFTQVVPLVDDLDELKVILLVLWRLARLRSNVAPWITEDELRADPCVRQALGREEFETRLREGLAAAVADGVLLRHEWQDAQGAMQVRYFANSPQGRAAVSALQRGADLSRSHDEERPNIFALYEQTIGPLTALLSEELLEAERSYPLEWIEEAFREAARLNKRNWKYVRAILERWQAEGRDEIDRGTGGRSGGRDREAEARRYIEEHYDQIIRH
ncbi:MAG TPA: DnaD domain protein [Chloroflexi bacterium]|nr:DnaD domain protein [Chloroflexota bacterium]